MKYVEKYLDLVLSKVKLYLRGYGGPIVMIQVCDRWAISDRRINFKLN